MMAIKKTYNKFVNYLKKNSYISATVIVFLVLILSVASFLFIKEPEIISNIIPDRYYEVTFQYNNGQENVVQKVKKGEKATQPENPTYEDYDFAGWYIDDEIYDFNKGVVSNLILMARYSSKDGELIEIPEEYINNNTNSSNDKEKNDSDKEALKEKEEQSENKKEEDKKEEEKEETSSNGGNNNQSGGNNNQSGGNNKPPGGNSEPLPDDDELPGGNGEPLPDDDESEEKPTEPINPTNVQVGDAITYGNENYHVIGFDNGKVILLLDRNIVKKEWVNKDDYLGSCSYGACNDKDPVTALKAAEAKGYDGIPSIDMINDVCKNGCPCWLFNNLSGPYNTTCIGNQVISGEQGYWINGIGATMINAKYMSSSGKILETTVTTKLGVRPIKEVDINEI